MKHEIGRRCIKRVRVKLPDLAGQLGHFATTLGDYGVRFGEISTHRVGKGYMIRDMDLIVSDEATFDEVCESIRAMDGIQLLAVTDVVRERHEGGKIEVVPRVRMERLDDLGIVYTPGVASICRQIHDRPALARRFTSIPNNVAIVTNGTAILGLGDIGPVAGMPVMEGKAMLFKRLAGINGYPILIDEDDPEAVVTAVRAIAPTFGAIKLEDIRAPECFVIEERLDAELDIPVLHDDQHGTAVVVLAALLNIGRETGVDLHRATLGIIGLGAAGSGIQRLLNAYGVSQIVGVDISEEMVRRFEGLGGRATDLEGVMRSADVVLATTGVPGLIQPAMVRAGQVILALSNPDPEIDPDEAVEAGAAFAADGKSVNNAMAFPGLFRGALDARARCINDEMKIAAARTIARHTPEGDLIPSILDLDVHRAVAAEVRAAAEASGVVAPAEDEEGE